MKIAEMKVDYVDHMGSDLTVVNAARVSFDKESDWDGIVQFPDPQDPEATCWSNKLSDKDAKLIGYLADHNHWSPFAHTGIQLRIKAPIFVARQLVKHQVGGVWNEVSRRYVDSEPEFWFPKVWRGRPEGSMKQGSSGTVGLGDMPHHPKHAVEYALAIYKDMLDKGVAPEQARMILPQNMMTEWYWTGSLMFFTRVCRERLALGAQQETREAVQQIPAIVAPLFPVSWAALVKT